MSMRLAPTLDGLHFSITGTIKRWPEMRVASALAATAAISFQVISNTSGISG
ncbi:MAG TPA: hypothetical protein VN643_27715 [Pyrinomonadaceae bacterium]|nr:hypothetical protein [Pyrinomonadaceae bacterium]